MSGVNMDVKLSKDITDKISKASEEQISQALEMIGQQAENYAILKCPVDTGRLRNSITFVTSKKQGSANGQSGAPAENGDYSPKGKVGDKTVCIGTNVEYAEAIELGGSKKAPNGFLGQALSNHTDEYKKMVESCLKG